MYSNITLQDLVRWTGAETDSTKFSERVLEISTDTRTLKKGDVFAALRGENFDGHHFLQKASDLGALAIISEKPFQSPAAVLVVPDTLQALAKIGRALRDRFKGPVFAVTGSAGKSSTRDMVATLLGPKTLKAPSSFNNLLGVSKTLMLLDDSHEKLVLEMGMNALGEIREMCEKFHPTLGLITNIGDAHIGKLGGKEGIYTAKKELFDYLWATPGTQGIAINADDPFIQRAAKESKKNPVPTLTYSAEGNAANVRIVSKGMDPETCYLKLKLEIEGKTHEVSCPIFGLHHAQNIAAAIAAVRLVGVSEEAIFSRLSHVQPAEHRGQIVALPNGATCIDESYNSNPSALKSSLHSLSFADPKRTRLIVVGEMRELGEFSEKLHKECGRFLSESHSKLSYRLLTVGEGAKALGNEVQKSTSVSHVSDWKEALQFVKKNLNPQDILFVKGSHGVRLDLLVDAMTQSVTK